MGYSTPEAVMNGWMNSSGHKANILKTGFGKIGIGIAKNSSGRLYWTQLFTD
ncbi:Cysteine-rich secretory protein family protein [compost metagenome]